MTPERALELARELGLDSVPKPRYSDLPEENPETPNHARPKFLKALQLVDQIETWAFERFIPDFCVIDHNIDAHVMGNPELHFAVCVRTDMPPPSNARIARATGIRVGSVDQGNFYQWLAVEVGNAYREIGAKKMGVPLIFSTLKDPKKSWSIPYLGAICKFDRTPPDGSRMDDMVANRGLLIPWDTPVKKENAVLAVADVTENDRNPLTPTKSGAS